MTTLEKTYLHALYSTSHIGTQSMRVLKNYFTSYEAAWHASDTDLAQTPLSQKAQNALLESRKSFQPNAAWQVIISQDIDLLEESDEDFPENLSNIPHAPLFLYTRGDATILKEPSIAIVGSRKHSQYGGQAAMRFAYDLAENGMHVISGLALGIDAVAHKAACEKTFPGKTVAVLGGGIDDASLAPRTHVHLAHKILQSGGCLISEYTPGTQPRAGTFPARNRIMAALAESTLVIEASHDSGTLITAQNAQDFGKKVYAIPGSIFRTEAVGTNTLIAHQKALLAQSPQDLLSKEIHSTPKNKEACYQPKNDTERVLYEILIKNPEGLTIDKIIRTTTLEGSEVSSTLLTMELEGLIRNLGGNIYAPT